jgi:sulfotransferase family protein
MRLTGPWPPAAGPPPARENQLAPARAQDGRARRGPVVVLTYAHAGGARLQAALADHPELACTSGTGVLPLCEQAAAAWQHVEDRPAGAVPSPLAVTSIRSLIAMMLTTIAARTGRTRWCETATVHQDAAQTFLTLYPDSRFICLHRACDGVIRAALAARPWGLSGPAFAPYTAAYPASTVAAIAAYWTAYAGPLVAFEAAHPEACRRVRCEDLDAEPDATAGALTAFLGLGAAAITPPRPADPDDRPAGGARDAVPLPVGQLPAPLLGQVNALHAQLGYPPLEPAA